MCGKLFGEHSTVEFVNHNIEELDHQATFQLQVDDYFNHKSSFLPMAKTDNEKSYLYTRFQISKNNQSRNLFLDSLATSTILCLFFNDGMKNIGSQTLKE